MKSAPMNRRAMLLGALGLPLAAQAKALTVAKPQAVDQTADASLYMRACANGVPSVEFVFVSPPCMHFSRPSGRALLAAMRRDLTAAGYVA